MCDHNCNLIELKAVQLIKDFTIDHTLYLHTNEEWSYSKLVKHLRTLFESGKTFNSSLGKFYGQYQKPKETEDWFANEL